MRDDYLWDRTGEPDAEIERLERTLGRLRHRPKPLELPRSRPARSRFFPGLAAAAAIVLMMLAAGTWLALSRSNRATARRLSVVKPTEDTLAGLYGRAKSFDPRAHQADVRDRSVVDASTARAQGPRRMMNESAGASFVARRARRERLMREGEAATEKLMLALHYASSKLNLVQKRIQVNKADGPAS